MIKAVLFDFDGVIHNTFDRVFAINQQIKPSITVEEYLGYLDGNIYANMNITKEKSTMFAKLQNETFLGMMIKQEIKEELIQLQQKHSLFIVSSASETFLKRYCQDNKLDFFQEVLGQDTHRSKEVKFNWLMEKYGLKKEECIFVTDTLGDLKEANNVGIKSIAVDFGYHNRERLEMGNPLSIVSEFSEIRQIVDKL